MNRWTLLLPLALILAGCNGGSEPTSGDPAPKSADGGKKIKVALLTPGPVSDAGWSAMAYEGLKAIEADTGAEVQNTEAGGAKIPDAMRSYAQKGFDLVIGHGYEYNPEAMKLAKDFPNTFFMSSSGDQTAENVGAFRFYLEQGFYLCGYMAAKMSKSGTIAMVGGDRVPSIKSTFNGFRAGAMAGNPKIKIIEAFTGDGKDPVKAKLATEEAIRQGADFVIHQANAAAQGVFDACKDKKVYAFGANLDQNNNPTGIVIASATIVAKPAFVGLAKDIAAGNRPKDVILRGMAEGAIDFVPNPDLLGVIPADLLKEIEAMKAKIISGELVIPKDSLK